MKRFYAYLSAFAILSIGMVACTKNADDILGQPDNALPYGYKIELRANLESKARAIFGGEKLSELSWEDGDALGIFIHDAEGEHIANNVAMHHEGGQFEGVIPSNPANRNGAWDIFAYYPYNSIADNGEVYHEESWLIKHSSRQTQIDANHSNYDRFAFFSSDNTDWAEGEDIPSVTLKDRTAALRFLIKAGEGVPSELSTENLEEVDVFVMKSSDLDTKGIKAVSESDGIVPLSGHFSFNHITGDYTPITGESRNYIEVDFLGTSTRTETPFDIKITSDNATYVWAVVPPFELAADEVLVAIFNTASYKIVYAYERAEGFSFVANKLYNFSNVVATSENLVSNDPIIHTNDYILGESTTATTAGINGNVTYRYPTNVIFTMEADLPIHLDGFDKEKMTYYIRYGFCDYCGADGTENHNGLDVPYSEAVEEVVSWAHEMGYEYNYGDLSEPTEVVDPDSESSSSIVHQGTYRLSFNKLLTDTDFLKEAFNGKHDPVFQAYAVYNDGVSEPQTYYGHVVHIDMDPFVSDIHDEDYTSANKTPITISGEQFYLNVPADFFFNGSAPAPYYWVNTVSSLRIYRCDVSSSLAADGMTLTTATLEEAVALNSATTVQLPRLQSLPSGYEGFYHDINTNGNGYIRYRESNGKEYSLSTDKMDDYKGAYCYVMQAYRHDTMELVWIRTEYFRLCDVRNAQ